MRAALSVVLLSAMLVGGCSRRQEAPVRSEPVRLRVATATRGELSQGITFRANLRATRRASVNAAASGVVARVAVHEGDTVRAGQAVAWLDTAETEARIREQEAAVQAAQARVASSGANVRLTSHRVTGDVQQAAESLRQAEIARHQGEVEVAETRREAAKKRTLFQVGAIQLRQVEQAEFRVKQMESQLQTARSKEAAARAALQTAQGRTLETEVQRRDEAGAEASVAQAQATLQTLQGTLEKRVLRSPISGVVQTCTLEVGQTVVPGGKSPITIVDNRDFEALGLVDQQVASHLRPGHRASMFVTVLRGRSYPVVVQKLVADPDPKTDQVKVYLDVPNPSKALLDGMRVYVTIDEPHRGIIIPKSAVVARSATPTVIVVEDGKARTRQVAVLFENGDQALVGGGLQAGDVVALDRPEDLHDGDPVLVRPVASASPR